MVINAIPGFCDGMRHAPGREDSGVEAAEGVLHGGGVPTREQRVQLRLAGHQSLQGQARDCGVATHVHRALHGAALDVRR